MRPAGVLHHCSYLSRVLLPASWTPPARRVLPRPAPPARPPGSRPPVCPSAPYPRVCLKLQLLALNVTPPPLGRSGFDLRLQSCSRAVVQSSAAVVALSGVLSRWRGAWADAVDLLVRRRPLDDRLAAPLCVARSGGANGQAISTGRRRPSRSSTKRWVRTSRVVRLVLLRADGEARDRSRREIGAPWPRSGMRRRHPPPRSTSFEPAPGPARPAGHPVRRSSSNRRRHPAAAVPSLARSHCSQLPALRASTARAAPPAPAARPNCGCVLQCSCCRRVTSGAGRQHVCSHSRQHSTRREGQSGQRREAPGSAAAARPRRDVTCSHAPPCGMRT